MSTSLRRAPATDDRHVCMRCTAAFRPALTDGDCPVCGAVGNPAHHRDRDGDDRSIALAVAAMALNLLVFGLVVWAVLG